MRFHELLGPSSEWLPLVEKGVVTINRAANRLVWPDGRFAAALTPSSGLGELLASSPVSTDALQALLRTTQEVAPIGRALEALQLVSTASAIASVANVGVSIAGFAIVLKRLNRIDGKLDQMMTTLAGLKSAIQSLGVTAQSLVLARLAAAKENLDRSIAAATERVALAREARRLFQESRLRYLELWRHVDPWRSPEIEVATAMELQGRYIASAIGELQAEFVLGDTGAFVHAIRSTAKDLRETMALDVQSALRIRCDAAADRVGSQDHSPLHQVAFISGTLDALPAQLRLAHSSAQDSAARLAAFEADAELPMQLGLPSYEILRIIKEAPGVDVLALGRLP